MISIFFAAVTMAQDIPDEGLDAPITMDAADIEADAADAVEEAAETENDTQEETDSGSGGEQEEGGSAGEQEEGGSEGDSEGIDGDFLLTEDSFQVGDIPEDYLKNAKKKGTVDRVRYTMIDEAGEKVVKSVIVYLPLGYEENDDPYNIIYFLHASGGTPKDYLNPDVVTDFQNLLDNMIEAGELDPLIVAVPTYTSGNAFEAYMPLGVQVAGTSDFPQEMIDYIIPAVESEYRTYAESTDEEGIIASRDHRAMAGFSLGGTATWNVFIQKMCGFRWFLPISEASWDDGEGGIDGIWDSDLSAEVLYEAVQEQGYTADDFILFVATGTEDTAFEIATEQMKSLLEYSDMFITGQNTSCSMMIGGTHTLSATYTYLYHILPVLFYEAQ